VDVKRCRPLCRLIYNAFGIKVAVTGEFKCGKSTIINAPARSPRFAADILRLRRRSTVSSTACVQGFRSASKMGARRRSTGIAFSETEAKAELIKIGVEEFRQKTLGSDRTASAA
jgi:hypothetical protein